MSEFFGRNWANKKFQKIFPVIPSDTTIIKMSPGPNKADLVH